MSNFRSILPEEEGPYPNHRSARPSAQGKRPMSGQRQGKTRPSSMAGSGRPGPGRPAGRPSGRPGSPLPQGRPPASHRGKRTGSGPNGRALLFIIILMVVLLPTLISLIHTRSSLTKTKEEQASLQKEKDQLSASVEELKNQLQIVNTDEFIEKYAHEKLGMIRLNEILVQTQNGQYSVDQKKVKAITEGQEKTTEANKEASQQEDSPQEQGNQEGQQ